MFSLLKVIVWVLFILTGLGFLGQLHWFFELIAPFRLQLLVALVGLSLWFGSRGNRQTFFVAFMGAVINGCLVLPVFFATTPPVQDPHMQPLRLLQMNVSSRNTQYERLLTVIQGLDPDVVTLEEVSAGLRNALKANVKLQQVLPYRANGIDSQTAILSRYPLKQVVVHKVNPKFVVDNVLSAQIAIPGLKAPLTLVVTHPPHPTSALENWRQLVVFSYLVTHRQQFSPQLIVAGDLNTTPWSHHFQALLRQMHLSDSRAGFGINPTWPDRWWPFRIPIDHVLVSPEIQTVYHRVGPPVGSDHLPVLVSLQF
jgi:endonuclease/exonuclease/phosphatase (EEP) superfamily protein YafD